jgi:hypothetical protein
MKDYRLAKKRIDVSPGGSVYALLYPDYVMSVMGV